MWVCITQNGEESLFYLFCAVLFKTRSKINIRRVISKRSWNLRDVMATVFSLTYGNELFAEIMASIYVNGSKIKQLSVKFCVKTSWLSIYLIYNLLSRFYVRVCDVKSLTHKNAFHFDFLLSILRKLDWLDMLAIFKLNSLRKNDPNY